MIHFLLPSRNLILCLSFQFRKTLHLGEKTLNHMEEVKAILTNLLAIEGILAAVVIGKDGFVIESVSKENQDTDTIGGIISGAIKSSEEMGSDLSIGSLKQSMVEYEQGVLLGKLIDKSGTVLAILASQDAVIGNVRYQLNKFAENLVKVLS